MDSTGVFEHFANFGSGLSGSSTLDNAKFSKLCRETHVISGPVTGTDVDLAFKKVLGNERRMNVDNFHRALELLGPKRFPPNGGLNEFQKLFRNFHSSGPSTDTDNVTKRLTDTSLYTGAHKHRFDENGHGRGLEGRDTVAKGKGHTGVTENKETDMQWKSNLRPNLHEGPTFSNSHTAPRHSHDDQHSHEMTKLDQELFGNLSSRPPSARNPTSSRPGSAKPASARGGTSIFDRLTDTSQYTGSHKHRFDANGNGRGLAGRDTGAIGIGTHTTYTGGAVSNLSQITRPNIR